jgi:hypothetical protein
MFNKRFKYLIAFLVVVVSLGSTDVLAQHQAIGLRLGEPLGFTYKRYLPGNKALEFGLGTAPKGWSKNYYRNSFEDRYDNDDVVNVKVKSTLFLQGRYLIHYPIPAEGIEGKFNWYWGFGAVLKSAKVEYLYRKEVGNTNQTFKRNRNDIDFGPELIGGLEYTFEDAPVSIFGELSLFLELTDRTNFRLLGGAGARFNF